MNILCLDWETFFDKDYSLSKMTTESYVRDPRFEALCLGVASDEGSGAIPQEDIAYWLQEQDWSQTAILAHHAQFDGLILSHHYNVRPKIWLDTLSMARQCIGTHVSISLESLAKHFKLQPKTVPYDLFKGKRWSELPSSIADALLAGSAHDASLTLTLFKELSKTFPTEEYPIVDLTVRMFTEPVLEANVPALRDIWVAEETKKRRMLAELGVDAKELASADKFADLLRAQGVEPETKVSTAGNRIYAFAKTDDFMRDLVEDEDATVSLLANARLGVKSTIDQTRVETLGSAFSRGPLPVYLRYCGAHTTRWSGGDGTNWQNFRRGGDLRKAIVAPEGHKLAVVDSSQIEARLLNYVAGQHDEVDRFKRGEDPYVALASTIYGRQITKEDKVERGTGKQGILSCGFGSGWMTFQKTAKLGIYGPPQKLTEAESRRIVDIYRMTHPAVVAFWRDASRMIARLAGGEPVQWRGCMEVRNGKIYGPNGSWLDYSTLRYNKDEQTWEVAKRNGWSKLYGGKLVENCLSGRTMVLTHRGWRGIRRVKKTDLLWDGSAWVSHGGVVAKGYQKTAPLNGVWMTEDHKVLTTDGWVRAAQAKGYNRAEVRLPGSTSRRWHERAKKALALPMLLRKFYCFACSGVYARQAKKLWVPAQSISNSGPNPTREKPAPYVRSVVFDESSLLPFNAQGLQKLWRSRHRGVRSMAGFFRSLLGRHVPYLAERSYTRTQGQQFGLHARELHLGRLFPASSEPPHKSVYRDSLGSVDSSGSGAPFGAWGDDTSLSSPERLSEGPMVHTHEPVYDIINSGSRHRFVVMGEDGPFIVHNCVQWLARIVISQVMLRLRKQGHRIVMTTHDEIVVLVKADGSEEDVLAHLIEEMCREVPWLPGLPLAAEGGVDVNYSK